MIFSSIFFRLWYLEVLSGDRVPGRGEQQPGARGHGPGAARRDPRPQRQDAGREPHGAGAPGADHRAAEGPREGASTRSSAARRGRGDELKQGSTSEIRQSDQALAGEPGHAASATSPTTSSTTCARTRSDFPGVSVDRVYVRQYPQGNARRPHVRLRPRGQRRAAQGPAYRGARAGRSRSARPGVESTYDSLLRGVNGATRVQVDAAGAPTGGRLSLQRARGRQQPADDARLGAAGGRRGGDGQLRAPRRLRGDGRRHRRDPRAGLGAELRPVGVRASDHPEGGRRLRSSTAPTAPRPRSSTARSRAGIQPARPSS